MPRSQMVKGCHGEKRSIKNSTDDHDLGKSIEAGNTPV